MMFYRVRKQFSEDHAQTDIYVGTIADAKAELAAVEKVFRSDVDITEVEVSTDKAGVLRLLKGDLDFKVGRTWHGTSRGGLKEILNDANA